MRYLGIVAVVALVAVPASAINLVTNGTFDAGLSGWTATGDAAIRNPGDFGLPASPSGGPTAGVINSWGGDWNAPKGIISQTVNLTGPGTLSGELFAAAHSADNWRNVGTFVVWNGSIVAQNGMNDADANKWAADFPWTTFSVPVVGTGANTLEVWYVVHFAEWSWAAADNLALTPEPAALLLGLLALPLLRRRHA